MRADPLSVPLTTTTSQAEFWLRSRLPGATLVLELLTVSMVVAFLRVDCDDEGYY